MKTTIVTIGTEILIGQVIDTNSAWIGGKLNDLGIEVVETVSIPDDAEVISQTLDRVSQHSSLIIMTGGLGPTKDDITKKTIAEYTGAEMYFEEPLYQKIANYFNLRNIPLKDAHREQCYFPIGVKLLENNLGTAPGMLFSINNNKTTLISMPGVPYEMKYIFENGVIPALKQRLGKQYIYHKTIHTAGTGETVLAELIDDIEEGLADNLSLAYLPSIAQVRLRITGKGNDEKAIKHQVEETATIVENRIKKYIFGYNGATLQEVIQNLMIEKGKTLGLAESCTGGYLSHLITSIPGSSKYFIGSVISYSNEVKKGLLSVAQSTLASDGAVSEETVRQMAIGAKSTLGTDYAVSISGVAGPGGGSDEKPIGTVYICVTDGINTKVRKFRFLKDRVLNIKYASVSALNLLLKLLRI